MWGVEWWLPITACAAVTWISLLIRFFRKGRLLGSRASRWCSLQFVVWTSCLAGLASFWLVPHASRVPPFIVGAVAGAALVTQVGRDEEKRLQDVPLLKLLTLYASVLLERLADQLKLDEETWCTQLAEGFCESFELQHFADNVRRTLLRRVHVPGRTAQQRKQLEREIDEAHKDAQAAVNEWTLQEREKDKLAWHADSRALAEADRKCRNAQGQAEHRCCFLLAIAYQTGKSSTDRQFLQLKQQQAHEGIAHARTAADVQVRRSMPWRRHQQ